MPVAIRAGTAVGLLLCLCPTRATPADAPGAGEQNASARRVAEAFLRGYQDRDLERIMAEVAVPWFHDGKAVLVERGDLEQELRLLLERRRGEPPTQYEIATVIPYARVRAQVDAAEQRLLDQVLSADDRLVLVRVRRGSGPSERLEAVTLLVRHRDGVAKVVGLKA